MMSVAVIQTVLFTLPLTSVNDRVVRFMLIVGHGTLPTLAHQAKGLTAFVALAVTGCWLIATPAVAAAVFAISGAALLLLGLRVLTYRLYNRRVAELVLFVVVGLLTTLAVTVPVAVPFCVVAVLWQLQRKSAAKRWLLG
jgi:membrane-bound ClpP family serine protease